MSDIFREVEEELRQDRFKAFWKQHGWLVILIAVGLVLGVGAVRGYQAYDRSKIEAAGARYSQALRLIEEDDADAGRAILREMADDSYASYPVLAKLREAAALSDSGETDQAVALYDQVAAETGADDMLRGVARIRAALLLVDTATPDAINDRVGALADAEDGPWRHSAREIIALSLYRTGDHAAADAEFDRIMSDPTSPVSLRGRAEMMRAVIAPQLAPVQQ